jgi:hypothetical protein
MGTQIVTRWNSYDHVITCTYKKNKVVPDSFRIILNQYPKKPEVKSLSPDGTPCTGATRGVLGRAKIVAGNLIPVGKETDRHWEHGDDPGMLDFSVHVYEKQRKMVVADKALGDEIAKHGLRQLMRATKLSQHTIEKVIKGKPVRKTTLEQINAAVRAAT